MIEKYNRYGHSLMNLAACLVILLLMKVGVFSSMDQFQNQGHRVMTRYYARHVGDDLADEVVYRGLYSFFIC